jgi:GWxTD domain-containing protein
MPNSKPEKQKLIPNVPRMVSAKKGEVTVYFEVYSDVATDASFRMDMLGDNSYKVYHAEAYKKLTSGTNRITYVFDSLKITGGEYTIRVSLLDSAKQVIDQAEKSFKAQIPGLPLFIKNVDKAIEEMKYIASQTDMDSLRAGKTPEERLERFNEFWKRRDPSEATEENEVFDEYFRRVNYANANFTHNIDGWKTDMGMVYILLGAPDNVDRHPFDINAKPYEVWEYYQLNQRLVFLDATGFGDYRLITPLTGDLYRYR